MCGAHIMPYSWDEIYSQLREFVDSLQNTRPNIPASYNIRPTTSTAIVLQVENAVVAGNSRWGLIPEWWKQEKPPEKTFNARIESINDQLAGKRGMWGPTFKRRRCLVISGGYYEWTGPKTDKRPHFIHLPGKELHAFAGLWESSDSYGLTHTIITGPASSNVEHLHHRMPYILRPKDYSNWLAKETTTDLSLEMIENNRGAELVAYEVSKRVSYRENDAGNIEPLNTESLLH